jgi:hypothetical protein
MKPAPGKKKPGTAGTATGQKKDNNATYNHGFGRLQAQFNFSLRKASRAK